MYPVAVSAAELASDVVTLQVASLATLRSGYHIEVQGLGNPFDGNHVITGTTTITVGTVTTYEITYAKNHANIAYAEVDGRVIPVCTWIGSEEVEDFLGFVPSEAADIAWLDACVSAANDWCSLRRWENDYVDYLDHVPSASVQNGTVLYAAAMFRERGSVDSFPTFQDMPQPTSLAGSMGQITRLLGLHKPRVA